MRSRRIRRRNSIILLLLSGAGTLLIIVGAGYSLLGAIMPWARAQLFGGLHIAMPGIFFALGGISAACAVLAVALRRYPLICLFLGVILLALTFNAVQQIPRSVRKELLSAQVAFTPFNQLLDQFHIGWIMVSNYGAKDESYIGEGIQRTAQGGDLIIIGSILGIASDPLVRRARRQLLRERCLRCGRSWRIGREALFCPHCSCPTKLAFEICTHCHGPLEHTDHYCVSCGTSTLARTELITKL
jgi:hypothetical protein